MLLDLFEESEHEQILYCLVKDNVKYGQMHFNHHQTPSPKPFAPASTVQKNTFTQHYLRQVSGCISRKSRFKGSTRRSSGSAGTALAPGLAMSETTTTMVSV